VVVEVLIPQRHAKYPLPDQRPDGVLDQVRISLINKTAGQPIDQSNRFIRPTQQQRPGIRTYRPAVKSRHHPPPLHT
jgi:hypothetical protein